MCVYCTLTLWPRPLCVSTTHFLWNGNDRNQESIYSNPTSACSQARVKSGNGRFLSFISEDSPADKCSQHLWKEALHFYHYLNIEPSKYMNSLLSLMNLLLCLHSHSSAMNHWFVCTFEGYHGIFYYYSITVILDELNPVCWFTFIYANAVYIWSEIYSILENCVCFLLGKMASTGFSFIVWWAV